MTRTWLTLLACLAGAANAQVLETPGVMEFSGRLIARPLQPEALRAAGLGGTQIAEHLRRARAALAPYEQVWHEPLVDHYVIAVPPGLGEAELIDRLSATGLFEFVEPDWILYPLDCPNDPQLAAQWHHGEDHLDSCAGWGLHTGSPSISIGVCDAGVETSHPDLLLNRLEGYNAVDRVWESQGGRITPVHPHGTQTTGCAAANGDNGVGVSGVGWNLGHRMLRVSNSPSGASTLATLTHAALTSIQAGDRVASVSYSGVTASSIRSTASQIKSMGGLLVWSAGNNGANLNWGDRDADDLICVGATNIDNEKADFSAYGPSVDLFAPGQAVFTTTTGGAYTTTTGTSFSTPLAAGLIALIWSLDPGLSPDLVEEALKLGCDDLGPAGIDDTFGHGRINVHGSLLIAAERPIDFEYPDGLPELLDPRGGAAVDVVISADAGLQGLPTLHFDDGSGYRAADLVHLGGDEYQAVFPQLSCGGRVGYYLSAVTVEGETVHSPLHAPGSTWSALAIVGVNDILTETFEADGEWTVGDADDDATAGLWNRMDPEPTHAQPGDDVTPDGVACWVTDGNAGGSLGEFDVDGGKTTLLSPVLDLSALPDPRISYWRWYSNDKGADPHNDTFRVDVNGSSGWVNAETVGPAGPEATGGWIYHELRIADFVSAGRAVQFRFVAEDAGAGSVIEAAIDEFRVSVYDCAGSCPADFDGDDTVNTQDVLAFLNAWIAGEISADMDGDGEVNSRDVLVFLNLWATGC